MYASIIILVATILNTFKFSSYLGHKSSMMTQHKPQQQVKESRSISGEQKGLQGWQIAAEQTEAAAKSVLRVEV